MYTDFAVCGISFCGPGIAIYQNSTFWVWPYAIFCVLVLYVAVCSRNNVRWRRPWALLVGTDLQVGVIEPWFEPVNDDERRNQELLTQFPAWRYTFTGASRIRFMRRSDAMRYKLAGSGVTLPSPTSRAG